MKKMKKTIANYFIVGLITLFGTSSVNAALVEFTLSGDVESADAGNIFNVSVGSTIFATGFFNDSLLTGGTGTITDLLITVGDLTFDNSMEVFGAGEITLTGSGALSDFTYEANEGALGALADFDSFTTTFTGSALNGPKERGSATRLSIAGHWDTSTFDVAVVPVPAAVWLFGSGLLALAGIARRKA